MFFEPLIFYGLLLLGLVPLLLGFLFRWPILGIVTGAFWLLIFSMSDGLTTQNEYQFAEGGITSSFAGNIAHYSVVSGTSVVGVGYYAGAGLANGEGFTPSSIVIGKMVQCIELELSKTGSPVGVAEVGFFASGDGAVPVRAFGVVNASAVTGSFAYYAFCVPEGAEHLVSSGTVAGLACATCDLLNHYNMRYTSSSVFDSSNTRREQVVFPAVTGYTNFNTADVNMRLSDDFFTESVDPGNWENVKNDVEFSGETRLLLSLISSLMMLLSGLTQWVWRPF